MNIKQTLQALGGSDPKILARDECKHDRAKHEAYGLTVLLSSGMAFGAGAALTSVFLPGLLAALAGGAVWSGAMFVVDRSLLVGISKRNSAITTITQVVPRLALSLAASTLISMPLEQLIFRSEINRQLSIIESEKVQGLREKLIVDDPELTVLKQQLDAVNADIRRISRQRDDAQIAAIKEGEGTAGSLRPGKGELFKENQGFVNKLNGELQAKHQEAQALTKRVNKLTEAQDQLLSKVTESSPDGLIARAHALEELKREDPAIENLVRFVALIITGIEVSPLLAKLLSKGGVYEEIVASEQEAGVNFYANQAEILRKISEADTDQRLQTALQLSNHLHSWVLSEYPELLRKAKSSDEFKAVIQRLSNLTVEQISGMLEGVVKGTSLTYAEVRDSFEKAINEFKEAHLKDSAKRHVANAAIDSVVNVENISDPWEESQ